MLLKDTIKLAKSGITVHKNRSVLTILGIVIGITSIVTVTSAGESAQKYIVGQFERFGPTNIFIMPGKKVSGPAEGANSLLSDSLKIKDFEDLKKKSLIPDAIAVVPYAFGNVNISGGESETYSAILIGSVPYSMKNWDLEVSNGRYFDDVDVQDKRRVVLIGDEVKNELFGSSNPIGKKVKIKNQPFEVIGVLSREGQALFVDFNKSMIAPYTSVQQNVLGMRYFQRIAVEASSIEAMPGMIRDIEMLLRNNHDIQGSEEDDFNIQTQESIANQVNTVTGILTALLGLVAAISLVVGGVGIMNIMYVSVTERTKEIGLSKALGATNKDILRQFLYEALLLTCTAGVIGFVLGVGLTALITLLAKQFAGLDLPFVFSVSGFLWGMSVSIGIGLIFGIFPARRASLKSPIEALHDSN